MKICTRCRTTWDEAQRANAWHCPQMRDPILHDWSGDLSAREIAASYGDSFADALRRATRVPIPKGETFLDYNTAIKRMENTPGTGDCFYCGMSRKHAIDMGIPFCLHPNPKRAHWFKLPAQQPPSENLVNKEGFQTNQFLHGRDDRDMKVRKPRQFYDNNMTDGYYWLKSERAWERSIAQFIGTRWFLIGEDGSFRGEELERRGWTLDGPVIDPEKEED